VSGREGDEAGRRTSAVVAFPAGLYSLDAIKKAAYRFSDAAAVEISPVAGEVQCTMRFLQPLYPEEAQQLADAFRIEVLDQDLRASIAAETAPMRNAILAFAFSKTGLQGE